MTTQPASQEGHHQGEGLSVRLRSLVIQAIPKLNGAEIDESTSLFDLGIDSLDHAKLLILIEDDLAIEIDDADINSLESLADLIRYCTPLCRQGS